VQDEAPLVEDEENEDENEETSAASSSRMPRSGWLNPETWERRKPHFQRVAEGYEARHEAGPAAENTATAPEATPSPTEAPAPTAPEQPPPAADEPVVHEHGKPPTARELMKELREAAEVYARERHRMGA
jgi:hypothetical protein